MSEQLHTALREIEQMIADATARITRRSSRSEADECINMHNEKHFRNGLRVARNIVESAIIASKHADNASRKL